MADSTVTIVGNLTRDPELRFTAGGKGVASFGVAVNRRYQVNGGGKRCRSSTSRRGTGLTARTHWPLTEGAGSW
jgi:hypothetical protein